MDYQAPKNPRHSVTLDCAKMWWVDAAWDAATLDWLKTVTAELGQRFDLPRFIGRLSGEAYAVHLPGLVPTAEWLTDFLVTLHEGNEDFRRYYFGTTQGADITRPKTFADWEQHKDLSEPVRFYVYLTLFAHKSRENQCVNNLLLSTATFTEADLNFLTGYRPDFFGWALPAVLRNAGFATHPSYGSKLEAYLASRRVARRNVKGDVAELNLILDNWNLSTESLKTLAAELEGEVGLAEAWSNEPSPACPDGTFDLRLREYREGVKFEGGSYLASVVPQYAGVVSRIQYHPNWVGTDFPFNYKVEQVLPWGQHFFTLPEASVTEPYLEDERLELVGGTGFLGDFLWNHYLLYRDAPYSSLRGGAEELLTSPEEATGVDHVVFLPAVGSILKERREILEVEEGVIPHEWVNLLFS